MGDGDQHHPARRSVVPEAAGISPWRAAIWTGLGAAVVCAVLAIVAVAVCWLPVSGSTGRTNSAIRAGLLTFLASVHGGLTVDGVATTWLPLGMLGIVAVTAWRAGAALADATDLLEEQSTPRLALAGITQAASFSIGCLIAVPFATLGTSRAPFLGVAVGAFVLFAATGGVAFVRSSPLRERLADRRPDWIASVLRGGAAATAVYVMSSALLVAGSLVVHHAQVESLSRSVGGGIGGLPVLLLGILAAPNAVIAGIGYLAGPGFAVGAGTSASLFTTAHGTLPAFPLLAAVPSGTGANPIVWTLAGLTPLLAACEVTRLALREQGWARRFAVAAGSSLGAGLLVLLLAWQGGGAAGDARLHTVGASPWRTGGAVGAVLLTVTATLLGLAAAWRMLASARHRRRDDLDDDDADRPFFEPRRPHLTVLAAGDGRTDAGNHTDTDNREHADKPDELAG